MRLVYVNADPGIPLWGTKGASVHVRQMLRALAPRTSRLTVLTTRLGKAGGEALPCQVLVPAARRTAPAGSAERALEALAANDWLEEHLDELAQHGEIDAIYERYSLWSVGAARVARRWSLPWILEVNAPLVEETQRHRSLRLPSVAAFLERELLRGASRVLPVSRMLADHVIARGADPSDVHVLPNGYDGTLFRPRREPANTSEGFTISFVGSLKPWHGVDTLVEAFLRLRADDPGVRLLIVGDGPLARPIRERLEADAPAESFRLAGAIPHEEVPSFLAAADVAVAPYPPLDRFYFSPLKVMEYAAMGLPIVASRVGQIAELLQHGKSALLTEPGDATELTRALRALRKDAELRRKLGAGARDAVLDRTWEHVADEVLAIVEGARPRSPVLGEVAR